MKWVNIKSQNKEWRGFSFLGDEYNPHKKRGLMQYFELKTRRYKDGWKENYLARDVWCSARYTILRQCYRCGLTSTPKKIQYRWFFCGKDEVIAENGWCCVSCYNKIKQLDKQYNEFLDFGKIKRKLTQTIYEKRKLWKNLTDT